MATATSKLGRRFETRIPDSVREALRLHAGDTLLFEVDGQAVRIRKAEPDDAESARAVSGGLEEWSSEADDEAYRGL